MQTISQKIEQMLKVADALGAPHYSLEDLRAGALEIERRRQDLTATIEAAFVAGTGDLDRDLDIIDCGARRAFAWIVGHELLPTDLDAAIDREDRADGQLGLAWRVAQRYAPATSAHISVHQARASGFSGAEK